MKILKYLIVMLVMLPLKAAAQENAALVRARQAYENLDYQAAIQLAKRALSQQLASDELVETYEMLGFM